MLQDNRPAFLSMMLILAFIIIFTIVLGCVSKTDNIAEGDRLFNESRYQK